MLSFDKFKTNLIYIKTYYIVEKRTTRYKYIEMTAAIQHNFKNNLAFTVFYLKLL